MKPWITALAATLLAAAGPALADNQGHGPARAALEAFADDLRGLHAEFQQRVVDPEGRLIEDGSGQVWISRPDCFRWEYAGEFPELIVADGRHVWLYDQALEQVTVKPQSGLAEDTPLMLLTDLSGLDEQFVVTELGRDGDLDLLELVARGREGEFERVIIGLRGGQLSLMVLEDAFGIRTDIRYTRLERNPALDSGLFDFEPPPGTDVIGEPGTG